MSEEEIAGMAQDILDQYMKPYGEGFATAMSYAVDMSYAMARLTAERDAMRGVVEAAKEWRMLEHRYDLIEAGTQAERDALFRADIALNKLRIAVRALPANGHEGEGEG